MKKLLIVLSGARPQVLDRCPSERGKFEGIGGAVLTTSVLATISMSFALHSALGTSLVFAIPASLLWGLAIMSLDRWLVTTIQAGDSHRWRMAVPRILMAVLIGVVISTPLVLRIFKSEIDVQIAQIKQDRASSYLTEQNRSSVGAEVARLSASVAGLQKVVASGGDVPLDPSKDPKIISLTAERDAQQKQAAQFYSKWQCQLYGGSGCTRKGDGVLARASESDYNKAKRQVAKVNGQIGQRRKELTATDEQAKQARLAGAKADLPAVQDQLTTALARQKALRSTFDHENNATNGLLIRLQALNQVAGKDLTLRSAHILLFLLFLLIECLPVSVKLMQKPGNYEKILKLTARNEFRQAQDDISMHGRPEDAESLRDIWERPEAAAPAQAQATTPDPGPTRAMPSDDEPPSAHRDDEPHLSYEHESLAEMHDTRVTERAREANGSSDSFELFPGDD